MIEEYPELVLSTYKKMRNNGELSLYLLSPTPAKLKRECLRIYSGSRYNPLDDDTLSLFFDVDKIESDFDEILSTADPDLFRPLINHINDKTVRTDEKNIELLAWLIDFKPRPSGSYYKNLRERNKLAEAASEAVEIATNEIEQNSAEVDLALQNKENLKESTTTPNGQDINEKNGGAENEKGPMVKPTTPPIVVIPIKTGDIKINGGNTEPPPTIPAKPEYVPRFSSRYVTISCIILLLVGTTSFAVWERWTKIRMPEPDEKFMYWDEDHYEPIKDGKQNVGAPIIPLNVQTLTRQRKINLPDTLTSYSIGKVWYKGHGKGHEFFTDSGAYPLDIQRVLKPLTNNILTKYTSNDRYLLTRLVWFICAVFFIGLCGLAASKLEKEVKHSGEETKTEKEEIIEYHNSDLQATSA
jgi:hypothetical protein